MNAITLWMDESEIINQGRPSTWIIGQLITNSDIEELDFLKKLRNAHRSCKTWDSLHACEFNKRDARKWDLLKEWIKIFKNDENCYFHAFIFNETEWNGKYTTPHHYWSHQICFGLGNKMKKSGLKIQTMFSDVLTTTIIMDRRSANTGYIKKYENGITIERINELEEIYDEKIMGTILGLSKKKEEDFCLRFSFANSKCFEGLQLCDCLTYMIRNRYMYENGLVPINNDFLELWNDNFLDMPIINELKDFSDDSKFNYFKANA
jgi:hypothetical protein